MQERLSLWKTLPSRSSQNISGGKYLHDVIQGQSSFLYLPKGLDSGCQMTGSIIHIYKERLLIQCFFGQEIKKYNPVSIPLKRFRIGLSGDGDCDSSQEYKEPSPYLSAIWRTIIKWLGIDITGLI